MTQPTSSPQGCHVCPGRAWLALALAAAGVLAYVLLLGAAWVRSTGAPAFVALVVAVLLASAALRRERRARTLLPALLTFLVALGFVWLFFVVARLPAATTFERLERAPSFALDSPETSATLEEEAKGGPVLLVFFRGHW